jgi:hypothetical protein
MKPLLLIISLFICSLAYAQADGDSDLMDSSFILVRICETHWINQFFNPGHFEIWASLCNMCDSAVKNTVIQVEFINYHGKDEGGICLLWAPVIPARQIINLPRQYLKCPRDCGSIKVSVIGGQIVK